MSASIQRLIYCVATALLLTVPVRAQDFPRQYYVATDGQGIDGDPLAEARDRIASHPFESSGYVLAARYFLTAGADRPAARMYEAAAMLDTAQAGVAMQVLAAADARRDRLIGNEQSLLKQIEASPRNARPLLDLAELRLAEGRTTDADKLVRRAAALDDSLTADEVDQLADVISYTYEFYDLAETISDLEAARKLSADGRHSEAIAEYRTLLRSYPSNKMLLSEMSAACEGAGDYQAALRYQDTANADLRNPARLLARAALLERAGLLTEATRELVAYYRHDPSDAAVAREIKRLYPDLERLPQARLLAESAMPALASRTSTTNNPGIVQSPRQSAFGLSAYPWFAYRDATGDTYRYNEVAGGLDLAVFRNRRTGIVFGASTHSISSHSRLDGIDDEQTRLARIGVGFDFGGPDLTQQVRQGSYRFTAAVGFSSYSTGKTMPYLETAIEHVSSSGIRSGVKLRSAEGISFTDVPTTAHLDSRVSGVRVYSTSSFQAFARYRLSLTLLGTSEAGSALSRAATRGSDLKADFGVRIVPFLHAGVGLQRIHYRQIIDIYFAPERYQRLDGWAEYQRRIDDVTVRLRSGIGYPTDSIRTLLPFVEGSANGSLSDQVSVSLVGSLGRDARLTRHLDVDTVGELFTVATLSIALALQF